MNRTEMYEDLNSFLGGAHLHEQVKDAEICRKLDRLGALLDKINASPAASEIWRAAAANLDYCIKRYKEGKWNLSKLKP